VISMPTTIQVSENLQKELAERKLHDKETYEEVIWDLMEDALELGKEKPIILILRMGRRGNFYD
jgi:rhodanese-related sulfurtransferase